MMEKVRKQLFEILDKISIFLSLIKKYFFDNLGKILIFLCFIYIVIIIPIGTSWISEKWLNFWEKFIGFSIGGFLAGYIIQKIDEYNKEKMYKFRIKELKNTYDSFDGYINFNVLNNTIINIDKSTVVEISNAYNNLLKIKVLYIIFDEFFAKNYYSLNKEGIKLYSNLQNDKLNYENLFNQLEKISPNVSIDIQKQKESDYKKQAEEYIKSKRQFLVYEFYRNFTLDDGKKYLEIGIKNKSALYYMTFIEIERKYFDKN